MLTDEDLEGTLRRYVVTDPPHDLRSAVLSAAEAAGNRQAYWWWGPAAAAVTLAVWVLTLAESLERPRDPLRDAEVAAVAEMFGGGPEAVRAAEWLVPLAQPQDEPRSIEAIEEVLWQR